MARPSRLRALVIATAALLPLTACSLTGGEDSSSDASGDAAAPQQVVLVTHDSFFLPKKLIKAFERDSGYDLVVRASGDGGTLTNKLVLSQSNVRRVKAGVSIEQLTATIKAVSPPTAFVPGLTKPIFWREPSGSTWSRQGGDQPSTTISAALQNPASSKRFGKRKASRRRN